MRKFLVFLLLALLGGGALWWFDRRSRRAETPTPQLPKQEQPAEQPARTAPEPNRGVFTEVKDAGGKGAQVALSGPLDVWANDMSTGEPRKRSHLVAGDCATLEGGLFDLRDTTLELFVPESGAREVLARAREVRARMRVDPTPALDDQHPVTLIDTVVTYETGSRFAPVTLRVPKLESVVALERAHSEDALTISGNGIEASGRGLDVERLGEVIRLREDPRATVQLEDGSTATLSSKGALVLRGRPDLGPEHAEISLAEEAHLVLAGLEPLDLRAQSIELIGVIERRSGARFRPVSILARNEVLVTPAEGVARGETLAIEFDESGKHARGTLDGGPELDLVLRGARLVDVPIDLLREGETLTVKLDGAGPLEFSLGDARDFTFTGPARLQLPAVGAVLECDSSIRGQGVIVGGVEERELVADGNVRFRYEDSTLTTAALKLRSYVDEEGRTAAELVCEQGTRVVGRLADGDEVTLEARGGLVARRSRSGTRLPYARNVSFEVRGKRPIAGRAALVTDLDVDERSFVAEGDVEVVTAEGRGTGERFEARSELTGELSGTLERPARLETQEGWFEALFLDVEEHVIDARGAASASVKHGGLAHEIDAGWIVAQRKNPVEDDPTPADLVLDAGGDVHIVRSAPQSHLDVRAQRFHAEADEFTDAQGKLDFEPTLVIAAGDVAFEIDQSGVHREGAAGRLELRGDRSGELEPAAGGKVSLTGEIEGRPGRFDLLADRIEFNPERLLASGFELELDGVVSGLSAEASDPQARRVRVIGGLMSLDRSLLALTRGVYIGGKTRDLEPWSLDAELVLLRSKPLSGDMDERDVPAALVDIIAEGSVQVSVAPLGRARSRVLTLDHDSRRITLLGDPDSEENREATIERGGVAWRSSEFTFDLASGFLQSAAGRVLSDPSLPESWSYSYDALEPLLLEDRNALVFRQPVWRSGASLVRANWAILWVDQAEWNKLGSGSREEPLVPDPDSAAARRLPTRMLGGLPIDRFGAWLHEMYLDGDVEYRINDVRRARAAGVYLDMVDGHGWVHDFVLDVDLPIGSRTYQLKVRADWLRSSMDGALRANGALATTCAHDLPHYVIKIGDFSVDPRYVTRERTNRRTGKVETSEELDGWELSMDDNEISFIGGLGLPLPRIAVPTGPNFDIDSDALSVGGWRLPSFGSDSKLGTFISANFSVDVAWIGEGLYWFLRQFAGTELDLPKLEGRTSTHVDLTSRGIVVGVESELRGEDRYRWLVNLDTVWDTGRDRGLVRVDRSEREDLRTWLHSRGRYTLGPTEWLDAVVTLQSDPGVQSEFFESNYLAFEERENFLYWRRVENSEFWSATAEARLEDYRTEVVDQPSVSWMLGREELGHVGGLALVRTSNFSFDHYARFVGDPRYEAPFVDGLGDRDVSRFDTGHRLELPWTPDVAGLRVTPYLELRGTGWSDNVANDSVAARGALIAGIQATTSLWRVFASGSRHVLMPSIALHGDLMSEESGFPIVQFDALERSVKGRYVDFSLRSRWESRELLSDLDLELTQSWADEVGPNLPEGWLPLATRANWLSNLSGIPFGVSHDARYDTDSGQTDYSRTFFGFEPFDSLDIETGYHTGRDLLGVKLYEAFTLGARYRFSPKWELEGRQTFSVGFGRDRLGYSVMLRRFGHDFVFEIDNSYVAGEGAGSLRFNITPNFVWRRNDTSQIDRWRALRR